MGQGEREAVVIVHVGHEPETRRFYERMCRFARAFTFSMLLGCAAPFVFLVFRWVPGQAVTLVYLGIVLWLFPFATPTTVEMMGIRNSVRLARAGAVLFVLGGVLLFLTI